MTTEPDLSSLRTDPPDGFVHATLERVGIVDRVAVVDSPVGALQVAFNDHGVCLVRATEDAEEFQAAHRERFDRPLRRVGHAPSGLAEALRLGVARDVRFDLRGLTDFERAVLAAALRIPPGQVRTYAWVASALERPKAVRAVGGALGRNPVPVLIPCHRVVRTDGGLGGYAFGLPMKRRLLEHEGVHPSPAGRYPATGP